MNTESKMTHSYDFELAALIGIHEALLYQDIAFWCGVNAEKPECNHDGFSWMFHSVTKFMARFPELTRDQIRRALQRLENLGLIASGCYNKRLRDKWYRVAKDLQTAKCDLQTANHDSANTNGDSVDIIGDSADIIGDSADSKSAPFGVDAKLICVPAQMNLCSTTNHLASVPKSFGVDAKPIKDINKPMTGILEKEQQQSSSSAQLLINSDHYNTISERTTGFDKGQLLDLVSEGVSEVDIATYVYMSSIQGDVSWKQVYEVFQRKVKREQ